MRIPNKVIINAVPYKVNVRCDLRMGPDYAGEIFEADQEINIRDYSGKDTMKVSFLHECIHGMLYSLGYVKHDEKMIDGLAHQLYAFIKDNPEIFKGELKNEQVFRSD